AEHHVIDCAGLFTDRVVDSFARQYLAGRTPNPCVECNRYIKFGFLMERALALGADYFATGHYVRILRPEAGAPPVLARGADRQKDQSYFLWAVERKNLERLLFPLGEYSKDEVRRMAGHPGLPVSRGKESQEVCFLAGSDIKSFLSGYSKNATGAGVRHPNLCPGPLLDRRGQKLGEHQGSAFYTIGQRRGLNYSQGRPAYVTAIDPGTNTVVLGDREDLLAGMVRAGQVNYLKEPGDGDRDRDRAKSFRAQVQVRYRQNPVPATVYPEAGGDGITVRLDSPLSAITPGQSLVLYDDEILLGGAVIESAGME
ncbi:MAG: tRNA 2-thiouridine(34) synthase MnmA, partial [Gemmatimonadota bacterium]|nr:tRNA 2-thiouridine(34) synthase MnmA [Gemmatimonadota bacterium]